jgi:dTMP kinase
VRLRASSAPDSGGLFIAFEGVEGSGKSTQVPRLVETLETEGREVVVTREPGGTPVAERIRGVLLDPNSDAMDARTEALLYAAARAEHVSKVIQPALARGAVVICDRFVDSSLAYQGYGRELGEPDVFEINRWAIGGLLPDVVVLLHLDPDEGLRRIAERARRRSPRRLVDAEWGEGWERGEVADRLEREDAGFHRRVGEGFLKLAKKDRGRFCIVDATADAGTVARQVRSQLHAWLPLPTGHRDEPTQRRRPQAAG